MHTRMYCWSHAPQIFVRPAVFGSLGSGRGAMPRRVWRASGERRISAFQGAAGPPFVPFLRGACPHIINDARPRVCTPCFLSWTHPCQFPTSCLSACPLPHIPRTPGARARVDRCVQSMHAACLDCTECRDACFDVRTQCWRRSSQSQGRNHPRKGLRVQLPVFAAACPPACRLLLLAVITFCFSRPRGYQ